MNFTVCIPIQKDRLPFLDKFGVKYVENKKKKSAFPNRQTFIEVECTASNLNDIIKAAEDYGINAGISKQINL